MSKKIKDLIGLLNEQSKDPSIDQNELELKLEKLLYENLQRGYWYKSNVNGNEIFLAKDSYGTYYGFINGIWFQESKIENLLSVSNNKIEKVESNNQIIRALIIKESLSRGFFKGVEMTNHQGKATFYNYDYRFSTSKPLGMYLNQGIGYWILMEGIWSNIK